MPVVLPFFAFCVAVLFFAIALKVSDRKTGSFFGKQHPMAKSQSDEPKHSIHHGSADPISTVPDCPR